MQVSWFVNVWNQVNCLLLRAPALYEPYLNAATPAIDEWTLSLNMAANGGLQQQLENHYQTFIVSSRFSIKQ